MDQTPAAGCNWPAIQLPLNLSTETVHVVRVELDVSPDDVVQLSQCLSDDERRRAERFKFDQPRARFVACRSALRRVLAGCVGVDASDLNFVYGPYGKPELAANHESKIQFSVSHSGALGLIALTLDAPVGVDIEECNRSVKMIRLAERFFAESETNELLNLPEHKQRSGFYRGWTCKEAYMKATGLGMSMPLSSFCVAIDPDRPASLLHVEDEPQEIARWMIEAIDIEPDYAAAVMVARPGCQIAVWSYPPR